MTTETGRRWIGVIALSVLAGFATGPQTAAAEEPPAQAVFFPAPPEIPRLQFLAKFSSELDVSAKSSGMRDFLFGGSQNEAQLVEKPYGLALFEGAIYVVDTRGGGYAVFDLAGGRSRFVRPGGAGAMKKPINITIDTDGTRYITDTGREQVLVFDRQDRYLRAYGKPGEFKPGDAAIDGDRLYVTDLLHHQIRVLDKRSGELLSTFGSAGSKPGELFQAVNLALGPDDTLWVSDMTNFRVQQFTLDGKSIRSVGQIGTSPGSFARPKGIAVDRDGLLYVVDAAFQNVQILDEEGTPMLFFGGPGEEPYSINMPTVVKIDYDNVGYFQKYAAPGFTIDYLVLVASQFGLNKVVVFGFGSMAE